MKNTKMSISEGDKAEVLGRKILNKINDIGHLTYKFKKDVNDIYSVVLSKPGHIYLLMVIKQSCGKRPLTIFHNGGKNSTLRDTK